jgi:hypothetical protein
MGRDPGAIGLTRVPTRQLWASSDVLGLNDAGDLGVAIDQVRG